MEILIPSFLYCLFLSKTIKKVKTAGRQANVSYKLPYLFFYIIIPEYADFKPEILTKLTKLTILKSVMKKMTKQKRLHKVIGLDEEAL